MLNESFNITLKKIVDRNKQSYKDGKVATYIPALAKANAKNVGVHIIDIEGNEVYEGLNEKYFTVQSISKIFTLILALIDNDQDEVFERVGMEPTGEPFNTILKLEETRVKKPYNPMINAGAITVCSLIKGDSSTEKFKRVLDFMKKVTGNKDLMVDEDVYDSERLTGNRNRALAYYLKDVGIIKGNVNEILDIYFRQCSILINSKDLANASVVIANQGISPFTGEQLIPTKVTKTVKAIMMNCGMYNKSGEFAIKVGLPSKSGVGGGIMTVVPNKIGIGAYGPALDESGNSVVGVRILEDISKELDLNIF